jgi:hypothetical protein
MRGGSKPPMRRTADQMPLNIECVADRRMNRNEALSGFGRFEALHLSFSSSNRLMRVFRTVVGTQSLRRRPVYIEARGHSKSRDICSVSLGLAVAWREYPVMSLQAAPVEEDRWSPVEVLIWIATRSRRFMDASTRRTTSPSRWPKARHRENRAPRDGTTRRGAPGGRVRISSIRSTVRSPPANAVRPLWPRRG